jgi:SAM-dependent methyltransferase
MDAQNTMTDINQKTIDDFDEQWTHYSDNEGWYGSLELFQDMTSPLFDVSDLEGKSVVDIGSGTGRIVGMILDAGAESVVAVEPALGAYDKLLDNVKIMDRGEAVACLNRRGDDWSVEEPVDYVFSIGVIQFIPDPNPTVKTCFDSLKPGGEIFFWLYSHEGNELYLRFILPLRQLTTRLPHIALVALIELLYATLCVYRLFSKVIPLPLRKYIETVWWPMTPKKRRLVIYDQLNPSYAKYHKKDEAIELLTVAGFVDVRTHHRHGYSWCVMGRKPA